MSQLVHAAPEPGAQPSRSEGMSTTARVLVVDADPATLAAISDPLRHEGHFVATAFDADGALMAARRLGPFELLITALRMSPTNGVELARTLREFEPGMQALYVTNCTDELFARTIQHTINEDIIEQPFSEHELLDAVTALLYCRRRPRRIF
jgi:DNA-binding response OmpR family regulator